MNARACLMLTILAWAAVSQGAEPIAPKPTPKPAQKPAPKPAPYSAALDFNRDVAPILSGHCYQCHGPGKPGESELVRRILSLDADERMPPPHVKKDLSPTQQEKLKRIVRAVESAYPVISYGNFARYLPIWLLMPIQRRVIP